MKISCPRPLDDGAIIESFGPTMAGVEPTTSGNRTRTTLGTPGALIIKISLSTAPYLIMAEILSAQQVLLYPRGMSSYSPAGPGASGREKLEVSRHSRLAP